MIDYGVEGRGERVSAKKSSGFIIITSTLELVVVAVVV